MSRNESQCSEVYEVRESGAVVIRTRDESLAQGCGRKHPSAQDRAAAVLLAEAYGARYAADVFGFHQRSVVRWRNGHVKRVAS